MAQMPNHAAQPQAAEKTTVTLGNWIGSMLLAAIPIVGLVFLFIWAFSKSTIKSKKNWAIAMLIFWAIGIVLGIISWTTIMSLFSSLSSGLLN